MIVDGHVHLIGTSAEPGCRIAPRLMGGVRGKLMRRGLGFAGVAPAELGRIYRERLVRWADESSLDRVCLLALDGVWRADASFDEARTSVMTSNEYLFEVCAEHEKFVPIASIHPDRADALEILERARERGAVAIKWLPNSQDIDPALPRYDAFYDALARLGLPLLTHTSFEHTIPPLDQRWGDPRRLVRALDRGATVIAAHCASSGVAHPAREHYGLWRSMIERHDRLYGDISAFGSVSRFPYARRVLEDEGARRRVMYGSDYPVPAHPELFAARLGWAKARAIARIANPLERNLALMRALGMGEAIGGRAAALFGLGAKEVADTIH